MTKLDKRPSVGIGIGIEPIKPVRGGLIWEASATDETEEEREGRGTAAVGVVVGDLVSMAFGGSCLRGDGVGEEDDDDIDDVLGA